MSELAHWKPMPELAHCPHQQRKPHTRTYMLNAKRTQARKPRRSSADATSTALEEVQTTLVIRETSYIHISYAIYHTFALNEFDRAVTVHPKCGVSNPTWTPC